MVEALPPLGVSGLLPAGTLLESLISICSEITSIENFPPVQLKNISTMVRRIKILSSLFEEMQEMSNTLPPSSILCLNELYSVIRRAKVLTTNCIDGSALWSILQMELISQQFYVIGKEMGGALDILPLSLLNLTVDVKEQVELLHRQAKRAELYVDAREVRRKEDLLQMMTINSEKGKFQEAADLEKLRDIVNSIGLNNPVEYEGEISKLEAEAGKQAGTGGVIVVSNIKNLISLLLISKSTIFWDSQNAESSENHEQSRSSYNHQDQTSYQGMTLNIPDEFRCPISLDLMKDPVIIASGHTYERHSIAQWINSGHHTCPKSGQRLIHMALIPNYALRSLIQQWCQERNIPTMGTSTSSPDIERGSTKRKASENAVDHVSTTKAAADAVKMTAEFLVGKLATGSFEIQRQAAYELRLLAKTGMDNRRIIAEAGAIPFLVTLLSSQDSRIQEHAVTTLLNLSIYENNKMLIMAAGAIENIVEVLQCGKTMESRENAAAAVFSLSLIDEYKVSIGALPRAISGLVGLLRDGTSAGKRDAATALFNLSVYNVNRTRVVVAGAVPLLINLLMDDKAGITDDALTVLALLSGSTEGLEEIRKNRVLVPLLIDLLRFGSSKGKENSITLLVGLCKDGGEDVARRLLMNPRSIPSLKSLAADGSLKARRKADAVLRLLNRCCSQSL
ncbi:hypothetical protein Leryth_021535 [Lithospermum erythrorhizon]|nr:hypothetical protein Leryth_021535 [Lithospermum erythrorhizon]